MELIEVKINWRQMLILTCLILLVFGAISLISAANLKANEPRVIRYQPVYNEKVINNYSKEIIYPESIGDCVNVYMENKTVVMKCQMN